jgi:hypothetical protein
LEHAASEINDAFPPALHTPRSDASLFRVYP